MQQAARVWTCNLTVRQLAASVRTLGETVQTLHTEKIETEGKFAEKLWDPITIQTLHSGTKITWPV